MQSSFSLHTERSSETTCSSSVDPSGSVNDQHVDKCSAVCEKFDRKFNVFNISGVTVATVAVWMLELQIKLDLASLEALHAFSCEFVRI